MKIKNEIFYRSVTLEPELHDQNDRIMSFSLSSEQPVKRYFGTEILDHSSEAVDLSRLNNGAPLLLNHDPGDQIGVILSAGIKEKRCNVKVKFSKNKRAAEILDDIKDGIRRNVSIGYAVEKFTETKDESEETTYRATRWMPLEGSIVSIPADATVGIGRENGELAGEIEVQELEKPKEEPVLEPENVEVKKEQIIILR